MTYPRIVPLNKLHKDDKVTIGLATAALLKQIRLMENPLLIYYFDMAWHALYHSMDETTRRRVCERIDEIA